MRTPPASNQVVTAPVPSAGAVPVVTPVWLTRPLSPLVVSPVCVTPVQASPVANHRARYAAQVTAMAKAAIEWADRPHDPFFRLRYLELAQLVTGADLSDDMDECRHELNIHQIA